ncbi:MAG: hypothetical protein R3B40_02580 [Polyangiales bacterium]|nr:hypothetical protein [Myxococcales bacterium]
MRPPRRPSPSRCLAVLGLLLLTQCSGPVVPILPPLTISAPDMDGLVRIDGDAEPDALVFGYNEARLAGVIATADAAGRYQLTLGADAGDEISVWQRVGTQEGPPRIVTVPAP